MTYRFRAAAWFGLACSVLLTVPTALTGAEITLREDLRARLASLTTIYRASPTFAPFADLLPETARPGRYQPNFSIVELSGPIEEGDADRLLEFLGGRDEAAPFFILFDSPGGNFLEGVRIGELLQEYTWGNGGQPLGGALVLAGAECLSACAVAFALSVDSDATAFIPRYVEQGARLGFHMPFIPVERRSAQTEIAAAMDLTYEIMSEYIQLIANGMAEPALVQNALHYRDPDAFFMLQGGLVTQFLGFTPVVGPNGGTPITIDGLTVRDAFSMCQVLAFLNAQDWTGGRYEFWSVDLARSPSDNTSLDTLFAQIGGDRIQTRGCTLERQDGNQLGVLGDGECSGSDWCAEERGQFPRDLLPPATGALLADTLACNGGRLTRGFFRWDWSHRFLEEETPQDYSWPERADPQTLSERLDWSGARMNSELTILSSPGGPTAAIWPVGTEVAVTDCRLTNDGQGVLYEVTHAGLTVEVSARLVDVPAIAALSAVPYLRYMIRPVGFE